MSLPCSQWTEPPDAHAPPNLTRLEKPRLWGNHLEELPRAAKPQALREALPHCTLD